MLSKKLAGAAVATIAISAVSTGSVARAQEMSAARVSQTAATLRFIDRVDPGSNVDVDLGAAGPSVGDQQVFVDRLMRGGKQIGTSTGVATITRLSRSALRVQVVSTVELKGGSLALQFAFAEKFADGPAQVSKTAVTGGTGQFAGASGQCAATLLAGDDDRSVVCTLHLPR